MTRFEYREVRASRRSVGICQAVAEGLRDKPKRLPTHLLYDHRGSELFEQITELPEYYPTRTERAILEAHADDIIEAAGSGLSIVEFGSGSSTKTRLLIEAAFRRQPTLGYAPIDISADFLRQSSQTLLDDYPGLQVKALAGEYFDATTAMPAHNGPRLIVFLGSNIGNLTREESVDFLNRVRREMQPDDRLLVGIDLEKSPAVLEAAYNDAQGVTAAFNRNLLRRVNTELDGHFELDCFRHAASYDPHEARVEMRLVSMGEQHVSIDAIGETFDFHDGEYIHTEWSHKYTPARFSSLAKPAGLEIEHCWTDAREWFALVMLRGATQT